VNIAKLPELLAQGFDGPCLWPRKQRVGPAHEPVRNEADPLFRGVVEVNQG